MPALDRAEGERQVGACDVARSQAGGCIETAREIDSNDGRATLASRLARGDGFRELTARCAGRTGAEQTVDDDGLTTGARLLEWNDRVLAEELDGERALGARVG